MIDKEIEEAIAENEEIRHHMEMGHDGQQSEQFQLRGETDLPSPADED